MAQFKKKLSYSFDALTQDTTFELTEQKNDGEFALELVFGYEGDFDTKTIQYTEQETKELYEMLKEAYGDNKPQAKFNTPIAPDSFFEKKEEQPPILPLIAPMKSKFRPHPPGMDLDLY